jgi:hypothetical protein
MLEAAATFAALSACSFPSTSLCPGTHSIWMSQVGLASWILSIISRINLMIYCSGCCFGDSMAYIAD